MEPSVQLISLFYFRPQRQTPLSPVRSKTARRLSFDEFSRSTSGQQKLSEINGMGPQPIRSNLTNLTAKDVRNGGANHNISAVLSEGPIATPPRLNPRTTGVTVKPSQSQSVANVGRTQLNAKGIVGRQPVTKSKSSESITNDFVEKTFASHQGNQRNPQLNSQPMLEEPIILAETDLGEKPDYNQIHLDLQQLQEEIGKCTRVTEYIEKGPFPILAEDNTLRLNESERAFMRNLSIKEITEMWEAECLTRKLAERRVERLMTHLQEVEGRYLVALRLNDTLKAAVDSLEVNVSQLVSTCAERETRIRERCHQLMNENIRFNSQLNETNRRAAALEESFRQSEQRTMQLSAELNDLTNEHRLVKDALETLERQHSDLEANQQRNEEKLARLKAENADLQRKEAANFKEICSLEESGQQKANHIAALQEEVAQLKNDLRAKLDAQENEWRRKYESYSGEIQRREQEIRAAAEEEKKLLAKSLRKQFESVVEVGDKNFKQLRTDYELTLKKLAQAEAYNKRFQHKMVAHIQQIFEMKYGEMLAAIQQTENQNLDVTQHLSRTFSNEVLFPQHLLNCSTDIHGGDFQPSPVANLPQGNRQYPNVAGE